MNQTREPQDRQSVLSESERQLKLIIDSTPAQIWWTGPDGKTESVNQHFLDYVGCPLERLKESAWAVIVHPDDHSAISAIWKHIQEAGTPGEGEARLRRHDGEYRWFLLRAHPLRDDSGSIVRWYGVNTDIEDRKRAEQVLAASERSLKQAIDRFPANLSFVSGAGDNVFLSQQFWDFTGLAQDPANPRGWLEAYHPDDREGMFAKFSGFRLTGEGGEVEGRLRRADGVYHWFQIRTRPFRDASGQIVRWYSVGTDIEERKSAEQALAASERDLKSAIDQFPATLWYGDGDGSNISLNQSFWDYSGLAPDVADPKNWLATYHPDDRQRMSDMMYGFLHSSKGGEVEGRLRRFDGVYRWFLLRVTPSRDASGRITRWYGVGTDIEDRKRAEQALAESERGLKRAIDQFPAMLWFTDGEGTSEMLNQHFWDFTGLIADEANPTGWYAAFHPDELAGVGEKFLKLLQSGKTGDIEARLRRFDGVYRLFLLRSFPSRDDTGKIVRWYGVGADIEDRKRAEAELQRAYRDLNDAQRLSKTGSYSNDYLAGEHVWSDELYRMFEFELGSTITSETALAIVHPDDRGFFVAAFERSAADGTDIDITYRIVTASGKTKYLHTVSHTSGWEQKHPIIAGAVQDITDTKLAELALDKARSELAHAARAMSLGVLTASIAHEVNQPLSGIITNANTCLRMLSLDPPNVDGALETARRTIRDGNRAADVISRLRTLFGKKEFAAETVDINEAVQEVIMLSSHELRSQHVALRTHLGHDLPLLTGDRVQLQQVVINLVLNAVEAMKDVAPVSRRLSIETALDPSGDTQVVVKDTGPGVTPEVLARIFDAFYTTKPDGMGIGLSVSRSIVERHGGRLWASPNDGPGATFSFTIPCPCGDGAAAPDLSGKT